VTVQIHKQQQQQQSSQPGGVFFWGGEINSNHLSTMARGPKQPVAPPSDPTGWLIDSGFAEVLLLHTHEIKYMAMLCYTFLHGTSYFRVKRKTLQLKVEFLSVGGWIADLALSIRFCSGR
jgi:hypothetical protein